MSNFIVVDGDTVTFQASFGQASLTGSLTTTITGSGAKLQSGAKACVVGDEGSVSLPNVPYTNATLSLTKPGMGTLTIKKLGSDQVAQKLTVGGTSVILVGTQFDATFKVTTQASTPPPYPPPIVMDTNLSYSGQGTFTTSNTKLDSA